MAFELPAEAVAAGTAPADSPFSLPDETQGFSLPGEATQKAIPDLVNDDDFDPISYAMETGDTATAKEVAWQKKQRPMTLKRAGHLVKNFGGAAIDLIKDFGGGLGDIAADTAFIAATPDSPFFKLQGIDENTAKMLKEAAATQQMARTQSIEHNTASFADKLFGKDGFFGPARHRLTQAVLPTAMLFGASREDVSNALAATETEIQDRKANPRKYFDDHFDELIEGAKKSQQLASGHVQDTGPTAAGLNFVSQAAQFLNGTYEGDLQPYVPTKQFASPEELPPGLIDTDSIRRGSVSADPINLLPLHLPKVAPGLNKVAGAALRTPVQAVKLIAEKTPVLNKVLKYGLPGGAAAGIGYEALKNPGEAIEDAAKALGIYVGVKGIQVLGHVIDNAGAKLLNPKFASAAEKAAAEEAMAGRAGFFNFKSNAADLERSASKVVQGAISAPVAMAPLNLAISDSPEELAKLEGGVFGFGALGGATSYNPVQGFHPETINAVDAVLRGIGEKKTYGTPLDAAHEAFMGNAPQSVKDGVNAYRGFFDGFKLKNGREPKIYVLPADQFGAEVNRRNPKVDAATASNQRGFADGDGTILVNGDFGGEAPDILGHEAGGHIAQTIMEMLSPHVVERLQTRAYQNLLTPEGKPTPELLKFVRGYNEAFDPTGKHQEIKTSGHAIEEWLAEQARAVLQGQGPAKFAAGESVRQRIADNIGDYFRESFGAKTKFDRSEIPVLAQEYRNLLFELGRLRGSHPDPTIAAANRAEADAEGGAQQGQPDPTPTPTPTQTPTGPAAPADGAPVTGPAPAAGDAYSDVGISQGDVRAARNEYVRENGQEPTPVRANKKKGTEGKGADEIMTEREAEFDGAFKGVSDFARQHGYELPSNPRELNQLVREWQIDPEGFAAKRGKKLGPAAAPGSAQTDAARPGPRLDRIEDPVEGDLEGGDFAIQPEEQAALEARGWTPEEIAMMPLHQVEAEVAAHKNGEPAPEGAEKPAGSPLNPPGAVEQPESAQVQPTGQLAGVSVPENAEPGAVKPDLADFDPNAPQKSPNPSTSGASGAPQQRPDGVPAAGAKEVPAVSAEDIAAALAKADTDAAAEAAKKRPGKARSPARIAADAKQARVDALTALLDPNDPGLHPVTDPATGETHFEGPIDPENPVHAAILKEFGYTQEHLDRIAALQNGSGQGVVLRDYNSAEQEGHETGEGLDLTGEKRGEEYQLSPTGQAGQRQGRITKQDKGFTPWKTLLTSKGVVIRGFDHDKFFSNLREILDGAEAAGIETGLDGKKGKERDQAIADAFRKVSENHTNGWKGDGSEPLKTFPDTGVGQNLDYIGQPVDAALADVINMAMNIRTARPPKPPRINKGQTAPTDKAQADFAAASAAAKEAQGLAQLNDGFLNPETGEVNALRNELESQGFETGKRLKPTVSNVRADLIEGGIHDTPTHGRTVHAHGFDVPAGDLTVSGTPRKGPTAAGFMPGDNETFRPIKVKKKDGGHFVVHRTTKSDAPKWQVTSFAKDGKPEGHTEEHELSDALISTGKYDSLLESADKLEPQVIQAEKQLKSLGLPSGDFVYVSEARPFGPVPPSVIKDESWIDVSGGTGQAGVLFIKYPLGKELTERLHVTPASMDAIKAHIHDLHAKGDKPSFMPGEGDAEHGQLANFDEPSIESKVTDNPRFKAWFGDSKVTDADGKPRVLYHGGSFDATDKFSDAIFTSEHEGIHFGSKEAAQDRIGGKVVDDIIKDSDVFEDDGAWHYEIEGQPGNYDRPFQSEAAAKAAMEREAAEIGEYAEVDDGAANITPVYLRLENPVRLPDLQTWPIERVIPQLVKKGALKPDQVAGIGQDFAKLKEAVMTNGFDGIVYRNEFEHKGKDSYIAFNGNQVKSAELNNGEFDPSNPDIRFMPGEAKIKVERWSEDSEDYDPWEIADKAEKAFKSSGINIARDKELGLIAFGKDGEPIAATMKAVRMTSADDLSSEGISVPSNTPDEVTEYEFDIGVQPDKQGGTVGYMLTQRSIEDARAEGADLMINKVINPKMAEMLEKFFGFEHLSEEEDRWHGERGDKAYYHATMVKWMTEGGGRGDLPAFMPGQGERGQLEFFDPNEVDSAKPSRWKLDRYEKAGDTVDGREVINADNIPNQSSIEAELGANHEVLPGIREVPVADFPGLNGRHYSLQGQKRIDSLADAIKASKQITPLIVVEDANGPYVLEGATRAEALYKLGAKSFPAMVVKDTTHGDEHFMPGEGRGQLADFNSQDELGFYSGLGRIIQDKIPNRASGEQILATIKGAGAKAEEIEATGLAEFLKTKSGPVSKQELADFVKGGGVQLKEVSKGDLTEKQIRENEYRDNQATEKISELNRQITEVTNGEITTRDLVRRSEEDALDALNEYPEAKKIWNERLELIKQRDAEREERRLNSEGRETKFSQYQLPGGENYKEVLLTLPQKDGPTVSASDAEKYLNEGRGEREVYAKTEPNSTGRVIDRPSDLSKYPEAEGWKFYLPPKEAIQDFKSRHWGEPNVLAHIRQADHTDTEGNKVRLIEEIQSDWHQKGRKEGYKETEELPQGYSVQEEGDGFVAYNPEGEIIARGETQEQAFDDALNVANASKVPDAPFKKTWVELAFKRALRMAVEDGMDKIAWTPGEQQAARYDLSKDVGILSYNEKTQNVIAYSHGNQILIERTAKPEDLPDIIGKEAAERLLAAEPTKGGNKQLVGPELKMGGKGMKGFYDKILPDFVRKYVKKWGGKVETTKLDLLTEKREMGDHLDREENPDFKTQAVHSVTITPEIREAVMAGQAMFMPGDDSAESGPVSEKQTLAKAPLGALDSPDKKKKGQLADFR